VTISDPAVASGRANMGVTWGMGNALAVFSSPKDRRASSSSGALPSQLYNVSFETSLYSPVMRKLVNESSQAFLSLQKLAAGNAAADGEPAFAGGQLTAISRQYRSIIRDCQEQLDSAVSTGKEEEENDNRLLSELLYKLELIWQLIEVLFIQRNPNGVVLQNLLQWVSLHFPQCEEKAKNVLNGGGGGVDGDDDQDEMDEDKMETHPDFWEAITLFVLQGKTEHARTLLRLHSEMGTDPLLSLDELLKKMPVYDLNATSVAKFEVAWRRWQTEVVARIDEGDFATDRNLANVARILSGSESAFVGEGSPQKMCETWYEWMVGKLLYTNPTVKYFDLALYADEAIAKFGGLSDMTALDSVILAALQTDIPQVVNELCTTLDNFWFPAHLMDLLFHAEVVLSGNGGNGKTGNGNGNGVIETNEALREFLLLDYATCLMSHHSLWQVGVVYLDNCPVQGQHRLELLLERIPLSSQKKAEKIVSLASERGMTSVVTSTCRVMGSKALRRGRVGTAMAWGLKSQDSQFTTFLADQLLKHYCESGSPGNFSSADLLDNLGSCMVVSERLTFLAKYREFHRLLHGVADLKGAATLLHSLLWSRLAPKYFWVTLLIDAMPFLADSLMTSSESMLTAEEESAPETQQQQQKVYFSSEQTYELLHCLQELVSESNLPKKQQLVLEENESQIRMKLARNLAVALMNEGDDAFATI